MVPVRTLVARIGAATPHGWRDFWLQFAVFWTFNLSYEASRVLVLGQRDVALANGQHVIDAERDLGIFVEHDVQHFAMHGPGILLEVANWTYFNCQFTISFAFMLWVYFRRNHAFYFVRNTILFADFIGLVGYLTLPTAPPRMFPGFSDTLNQTDLNHNSSLISRFANPYAAMPSLHTAYALTVGITGVLVCRHLVARVLWAFYPGLVVYSIVATGNHFVLDAVAGAGVATFAALLALAVVRGRLPRRGRQPQGFLVPQPIAAAGD
jgi:membrane-associated phospholipid phosphatase